MITISICRGRLPSSSYQLFSQDVKTQSGEQYNPFLSMQFGKYSHHFCFRIKTAVGGVLLFSGFPVLLTKPFAAGWTVLVECDPAVCQEETASCSYNTCSQLFSEIKTGVSPCSEGFILNLVFLEEADKQCY